MKINGDDPDWFNRLLLDYCQLSVYTLGGVTYCTCMKQISCQTRFFLLKRLQLSLSCRMGCFKYAEKLSNGYAYLSNCQLGERAKGQALVCCFISLKSIHFK